MMHHDTIDEFVDCMDAEFNDDADRAAVRRAYADLTGRGRKIAA